MGKSLTCFAMILVTLFMRSNCEEFIEDFGESSDVSEWKEHSDTMMPRGRSKASFDIHDSDTFRRAILFTMLDPHSGGAAFAGIFKNVTLDTSEYKAIVLRIRGQGQFRGYEFVLREKYYADINNPNYVYYFQAPKEFKDITLRISDFKPFFQGRHIKHAKPLNKKHITSIGILAYGGLYHPIKQSGVASLEIDWIKLQ